MKKHQSMALEVRMVQDASHLHADIGMQTEG